ncbi:MAG TPA: hypothetical protein VFB65_03900 [Pyrinomonadaceae bacterium]|nr:hypothetical protein [Pyrinomonadaceae bacterium]
MIPSRILRLTSWILLLILVAGAALGYDIHLGMNITETFVDGTIRCFG